MEAAVVFIRWLLVEDDYFVAQKKETAVRLGRTTVSELDKRTDSTDFRLNR